MIITTCKKDRGNIDIPYFSYVLGTGGLATYMRVCPDCGRFVKADETAVFCGCPGEEETVSEPNATCKRCGRVEMPFMGFFEK